MLKRGHAKKTARGESCFVGPTLTRCARDAEAAYWLPLADAVHGKRHTVGEQPRPTHAHNHAGIFPGAGLRLEGGAVCCRLSLWSRLARCPMSFPRLQHTGLLCTVPPVASLLQAAALCTVFCMCTLATCHHDSVKCAQLPRRQLSPVCDKTWEGVVVTDGWVF